jgi:short-subunit dehydrogenase
MNTTTHKGTALITGASSGIGALYAERLARAGHDLILVARRADKLRQLAEELTNRTGRSVETVAADLTDPADLIRIEALLRRDASITVLVNNAGVGATTPLLLSDVADMERMITLNVNVLMRLAYAAAPGFVARGAGTIINIASVVALAPELLNGVYGGSKAFVLAFSQSLQHELADKGVRVQAVLPAPPRPSSGTSPARRSNISPPRSSMSAQEHGRCRAGRPGPGRGSLPSRPCPMSRTGMHSKQARKALGPSLSRAVPALRYAANDQ